MTYEITFEPPPFDYDNDGNEESPKFVIEDNLQVTYHTRTGYLISGSGSTVVDVITDLYEDLTGDEVQADGRRQGFYLDLGGGVHSVEIEGQITAGESAPQWGTGDDDELLDQTGSHPIDQIQLLDRVLQLAEIDSRNPATIQHGMYSDDGPLPPLNVGVEEPQLTHDAERESSTATVSMTFVEVVSPETFTDGNKQDAR